MSENRPAVIEITADSRALGAKLREASSKLAGFAASSARVVGRAGTGTAAVLYRGAEGFARTFGPALKSGAVAVGAGAVIAAGQLRDFEEGMIRLKINAGASAEQMDRVRHAVRAASSATGLGSRDILAGVSRYVDLTGDFEGASKQVATFARVAQASDSAVMDVAQNAAAMGDALKIAPEDAEAAFSALITQGKKGSVTMKELARELPQLAPTMAQFKGGTGLAGLRELGAAMQIINKRYNSASESATAFNSLAIALQSRAGRLEKAGVKVFDVGADGTKRLKDFYAIVDAIGRSSLMKDPGKLIRTLGRAEAVFPLQQLIRLREERDAIRAAGEDTGAVQRDLTEYTESRVGKFNRYYNAAKEGAQGLVADVIEGNIQAVDGFRAAFNGDMNRVDRERMRLESDDASKRKYDLAVMQRYAAKGLVISPTQARMVWNAEETIRWQEALAKLGLAPAVTDEQRAHLRELQSVTTGAPTPEEAAAAAAASAVGVPWLAMAQATQTGSAGVGADGEKFTTQMSYALERAMTNALRNSGLTGPLRVGADAVAGAAKSAPSLRRRP